MLSAGEHLMMAGVGVSCGARGAALGLFMVLLGWGTAASAGSFSPDVTVKVGRGPDPFPFLRHAKPGAHNPYVAIKTPTIPAQEVTCPSCGVRLKQPLECHLNAKDGYDRDFCEHHAGSYAHCARVWLCPDCGYADFFTGWTNPAPLKPEIRQWVRENLQPQTHVELLRMAGIKKCTRREGESEADFLRRQKWFEQLYSRPSEFLAADLNLSAKAPEVSNAMVVIPAGKIDWLKYKNAVALYEARNKEGKLLVPAPYALMATLYAEAAHACRRRTVGAVELAHLAACFDRLARRFMEDPGDSAHPAVVLKRINDFLAGAEDAELAAARRDGDYLYSLQMTRAQLYDRLGRLDLAAKCLEEARACVPQAGDLVQEQKYPEALVERSLAEVNLRLEMIQSERRYLRQAAVNTIYHLVSGQARAEEVPVLTFLVGEFLRRAGYLADALAWLEGAQSLAQLREKDHGAWSSWIDDQLQSEEFRDKNSPPRATTTGKVYPRLPASNRWDQILAHLRAGVVQGEIRPVPSEILAALDIHQPATETGSGPAKSSPSASAAPGAPLAAEQVLTQVFLALKKYRQKKGQAPEKLTELLSAGLLEPLAGVEVAEAALFYRQAGRGERLKFLYDKTARFGSDQHYFLIGAGAPLDLRADGTVVRREAP